MIYAKESSDSIRAIITDLRGKFQMSNWEAECAKNNEECLDDGL